MDVDSIRITEHVKQRFSERFLRVNRSKPKNSEATLRKLLADAEEVERPHAFYYVIKHHTRARYFAAGNWYFVFDMPVITLITAFHRDSSRPPWPKKEI